MNPRLPPLLILLFAAAFGCCSGGYVREAQLPIHLVPFANTPLNQVQLIGSHNSYKRAGQPQLRELLRIYYPNIDEINYNHLSLTDQLNLGLRNLEIDVYNDPVGGSYANPMGNRMLRQANIEPWPRPEEDDLNTTGFKVLHDADFDFRTDHIDFVKCLGEMRAWSEAHPWHEPVIVTMNTKQGKPEVPGAVQAAEFDTLALKRLNDVIRTTMQGHLTTPDDIRRGRYDLRSAVVDGGWPTLHDLAGRFIFVLDEGDPTRARYIAAFPGLDGAVFFPTMDDDKSPLAAIFIINDPLKDQTRIKELVQQGFLVRTRADADTHEARDFNFARFDAAKASGAQVITTDYYIPDRSIDDRYFIRFDDGAFMRLNPVTGR